MGRGNQDPHPSIHTHTQAHTHTGTHTHTQTHTLPESNADSRKPVLDPPQDRAGQEAPMMQREGDTGEAGCRVWGWGSVTDRSYRLAGQSPPVSLFYSSESCSSYVHPQSPYSKHLKNPTY